MNVLVTLVPLFLLLLPLAVGLVQHYASPGTSLSVKALTALSFWLGFGGIVLLPIDLSLTTSTDEQNHDGSAEVNATYLPWQITYWSTMFLAWMILPPVRKALQNGHFTVYTRLRGAIQFHLRFYMFFSVVSVAAVLFIAIRLHTFNVIPILMALSNTYGLLLSSLLLGYGLVDVPRKMWRHSLPDVELRRTQILANAADEALFEAVWELQDCEDEVDASVDKIDRCKANMEVDQEMESDGSMPYEGCVQALVQRRNQTANLRELQNRRTKRSGRSNGSSSDERNGFDRKLTSNIDGAEDIPTISDLAALNARMKRAQSSLVSAEQRWTELVDRSKLFSAMVNSDFELPSTGRIAPTAPLLTKVNTHLSTIGSKLQYLWVTKLICPVSRLLAMVFAVLSGLVLWSETTMSFSWNLSPFALFLSLFDGQDGEEKGIMFRVAALVPLLYMSACVYSSLFKISFFGPYCLRGYKQSHGVALTFNAQYLIRMQFPLGYNYLLMLKYDTSSTNCAFSALMSDMSTVPFFGTSFSVYAPLLILCLCCFTLFNGYSRLLALLGIQHEDAILSGDQETLDRQVSEGIVLLRRHTERTNRNSATDDEDSGEDSPSQKSSPSRWWYGVV